MNEKVGQYLEKHHRNGLEIYEVYSLYYSRQMGYYQALDESISINRHAGEEIKDEILELPSYLELITKDCLKEGV